MYLKYYFKYMYFKILPITENNINFKNKDNTTHKKQEKA